MVHILTFLEPEFSKYFIVGSNLCIACLQIKIMIITDKVTADDIIGSIDIPSMNNGEYSHQFPVFIVENILRQSGVSVCLAINFSHSNIGQNTDCVAKNLQISILSVEMNIRTKS